MKSKILISLVIISLFAVSSFAQTPETSERPRIIVVGSSNNNAVKTVPTPTPTPNKIVVITDNTPKSTPTPKPTPYKIVEPKETPNDDQTNVSTNSANSKYHLTYGQIKSKIAEAKRQMSARPISTASVDNMLLTEVVKLAFYDWETKELDYVVVPKEQFLSRASDMVTISANGKGITVRTIRGNGVNTPVIITDQKNISHLPLLVQYPRENKGVLQEIAFYISTHPGIVTPEVVNAGKLYVRNTIDIARENLRKRGIYISAEVTDMAERLAVVEHIDHWRFRNEYHPAIFNDVFALFALNEGETYKYSVSSAGAGGMVQMIPSTYRMVRARYPQVILLPDFVEGMRDHVNASQAMLLYMQWTWNDLTSSSTVSEAIRSGIATPAELMSAGYNSNPARLAGYIKRGGENWKNLIPRETQIYLEINESFDKHFPQTKRTK